MSGTGAGLTPARRRRLRLALAAISASLALVVVEIALQLAFPDGVYPPGIPDPEDRVYTEHDAELGWRLIPGRAVMEKAAEFENPVRISAEGLRSDRRHEPGPSPGTRRVLAVGDSFTFGVGVAGEDAWPAQLEQLLAGSEVVNLGVPGWGNDQMLLDLRRRIERLRPSDVVLALFAGDVPRNTAEDLNGYPKPWLEPDGNGGLVTRGVPVPKVSVEESLRRMRGPAWLRVRLIEIGARALPQLWRELGFGESWRRTEAIVSDMARLAREHGARFHVVLIPRLEAVEGKGLRRFVHGRAYVRLDQAARAVVSDPIDPRPALAAWAAAHPERRAYWPLDHHLTAAGQRIVAEAIAARLAAIAPEPERPRGR